MRQNCTRFTAYSCPADKRKSMRETLAVLPYVVTVIVDGRRTKPSP